MTEIRSAEAALIEAERLLATVSEKDTSTALWKSSAVCPLAAILLAVTHDNGGQATLAAVHNVAARPDAGTNNPGVPDWHWAAQTCPNDRLAEALGQTLTMNGRQRDSIKSVILDALLNEMGAKIIAASPADTSAHIFDGQRHAWITAHAGIFTFQKRRAALLNKQLRDRDRARIGVHLDPHGAQIAPPPLLLRGLEILIVAGAALAAPIGWAAGRELRQEIGPAAGSDNDIPTRLAGLLRERHVSHRAFSARHHWGRPPEKASNYRRDATGLSLGIKHRKICRRHLGVSQSGARHAEKTFDLQSQRHD